MTDMLLGVKCGCQVRQYTRLIQDDVRADGLAIVYCPKHAAVDDLVEALKTIAIDADHRAGGVSSRLEAMEGFEDLATIAEAAIAQATAQD